MAGAGASAGSNMLSTGQQGLINQALSREQRHWATKMYRNRYRYTVADMKAAGLNPIYALTGGGGMASGGMPAGSSASVSAPGGADFVGAASTASQMGLRKKEGQRVEKQTDLIDKQTDLIDAQRSFTNAQEAHTAIDAERVGATAAKERALKREADARAGLVTAEEEARRYMNHLSKQIANMYSGPSGAALLWTEHLSAVARDLGIGIGGASSLKNFFNTKPKGPQPGQYRNWDRR